LEEWIIVEHPDLDAPATTVTRKHYELNLRANGFRIQGEEEEKPAKTGKPDTKEESSS